MTEQNLTGYPSIDRPWLKYYSEEALNAPLPEGSMYDYMTACNVGRMDETALNYFGRKISHRQLQTEIDRCARALVASGVKPGDVVSLCMLAIPEMIYLLYAINKIGAVANFVVLNATPEELREQISAAKSKLVFTVGVAERQILEVVKNSPVEQVISVSLAQSMTPLMAALFKMKKKPSCKSFVSWSRFIETGNQTSVAYSVVTRGNAAVIEYTGGTTGKAKGVLLSNLSINAVAFDYRHAENLFDFQSGERFLCCVPPFLAVGLSVCYHMPLCLGFELILSPDPSPAAVPQYIRKYHPNHVLTGALHIDQIISDKALQKADLSFLYTVACGGDKKDALWEETATHFLAKHHAKHGLINGYGLSETAGSFCTTMHHSNQMLPFVRNNLMIVDPDTNKELPYDSEGEVLVSGPSLMIGYWNSDLCPDKDVFFIRNGVKWLRTGDLGTISSDGHFYITGRLKRILWATGEDQIVNKIYPMQIEEVILHEPAVKRCAVVGRPDEKRGFLPIAFIELADKMADKDAVSVRISRICKKGLKENAQPKELIFIEAIPYTRTGKVDYRALEQMAVKSNCAEKQRIMTARNITIFFFVNMKFSNFPSDYCNSDVLFTASSVGY